MATTEPTTPVPGTEPDDADDLRGRHFRELLRTRSTYVWIALGSIALGLFMWLEFTLTFGAICAVASIPFGFWCAWKKADSRAADDFFHVYARQRHFELGGRTEFPMATPLLWKGDKRYAERTLKGKLVPGVRGTLAMFTVVTEHVSGNRSGGKEKNYHPYTLGMAKVPGSQELVPELYLQQRSGIRSLDGLEDAFRQSKKRVELESGALDQKFEIFSTPFQDENWLRQLFSPSFIVWLTEAAPADLSFELVDETLVVWVRGFREDAVELDGMATATGTIAKRLREESAE